MNYRRNFQMAKNYENENKTSIYSTDKATSKNAMGSQDSSKNASRNSSKNASRNKTSNAYNKEQDDYSDRY